jgi:hypothetical protein
MLTIQRLKAFGKIYLGTTVAYGSWHAFRRERLRPVQQLAIVMTAPLLWPAFMADDFADHFVERPSLYPSDDSQ